MAEIVFFQLTILTAGFTQGFTGFGSALVMLPLLTLIVEVKTAVPLITLLGIGINLILFLRLGEYIQWKRLRVLFISCIPGILLGVYFLKTVPAGYLQTVIGVVLLLFPSYLLSKGVPGRELAPVWAFPVGFLSGFLSGSISAGGPPVILYTAMQPWGKIPIKSTLVGFFLITSMAAGSVQIGAGLMTAEVLQLFAAGIPALVIGVLTGSRLFERVESKAYRKALLLLLILLGMFMLVRAAS
ncbi:MAG: sulfite exporter TauE/SafE family protein [Pseudomonadota bacterium]|jgi:uncharacterized membrane protein YfcA